jgi:hypothetical protein
LDVVAGPHLTRQYIANQYVPDAEYGEGS